MTTRALLLIAALALVGCDQSESDMGDQRKANAYDASPVFADGASLRPAVAGTVPRNVDLAATRPAVTAALIERGQTGFLVHCSVCHGRLGNGDGMIVRRGFPPPPSFHAPRLRAEPDEHLFNVITNGYGAMLAYGERIAPADRWAIVAYVRALQLAPDVAGDKLDANDRAALLVHGDPNGPRGGGTR